ncbi:MAG: hypothetical protein K0Q55_3261 [Verrucomicrobia bacterium]|nr:hypothetical protein [Verrucomicrobiota bacterium]
MDLPIRYQNYRICSSFVIETFSEGFRGPERLNLYLEFGILF